MQNNTNTLATIGQNGEIVISLTEFSGKKYLDIRKYFKNDESKMLPTKKGITLNLDQVDELRGVLNNNFDEIEKHLSK